jgi:hypothetical protein
MTLVLPTKLLKAANLPSVFTSMTANDHRSPKVVDDIIDWLRLNYESIFEDGSGKMKVSRGKIHDDLGMTLDFTTRGIVRVTMFII